MFVLGADTDDVQTVRDTVNFALKNHIDTVMLNILTPLPGTQQFEELDAAGRIFDKRWQLYDAQHVVFQPKQMTPYELQIEVLRGYMRFYSLRTWLRYIFTLQFTKQLLFHWWGMVIIRNWRKDERNKAFMAALKRMAPRLASGETTKPGRRGRPAQAPANFRPVPYARRAHQGRRHRLVKNTRCPSLTESIRHGRALTTSRRARPGQQ